MNSEIVIKKAIVTGPTGALGTALIERLVQEKVEVTAVIHKGSTRIGNLPKSPLIHLVECDLSDLNQLSNLNPDKGYDAFFHLAWDGTFGEKRNDLDLQLLNVSATLRAVEQAKNLGCKVFLGVGSQAEFGHKDSIVHPYDVCNPDTGYGAAKLEACLLSRILCQRLGLKHIWCRVFSAYGPHDGPNSLVMSEIATLSHSNSMDFTKGEQIWDYIYSKDAAQAFDLAARKGIDGSIYCIGSGHSAPLKDFIVAIKNAVNPKAEIHFGAKPYYPNQAMCLNPIFRT
jgi:UDP-glucose 4-epimerase